MYILLDYTLSLWRIAME